MIPRFIVAAFCVLGPLTYVAYGGNINGEATYVSFSVPGALGTYPMSINASMEVTGYYYVSPTVARGFLRALGYSDVVRSPTYTLVETYDFGALTVVHADLYRLQDPDEFEALGLRDLSTAGHVWLIEWPQRAGPWLPEADLHVTLAAEPSCHTVELRAATPAGVQWLAHGMS